MCETYFALKICDEFKKLEKTVQIWSYIVEGVVEYSRIVNDVSIAVVLNDEDLCIKEITTFNDPLNRILENFAKLNSSINGNDIHSNKMFEKLMMHLSQKLNNNNMIFFDHFTDDSNHLVEAINKSLINHANFICININPSKNSDQENSLKFAKEIPNLLFYLVQKVYQLCSTTITGIPMKEEQNTLALSTNYDVEIFHSQITYLTCDSVSYFDKQRLAENSIFNFDTASLTSKVAESSKNLYGIEHEDSSKKLFVYRTILLQWCTPSKSALQSSDYYLQNCHGAYKISPADPHSRPTSCLTNFVLSNRNVMLEQNQCLRKAASIFPDLTEYENGEESMIQQQRIITHMLTQIEGTIYVLTLPNSTHRGMLEYRKCLFDNVQSITEGSGGKVTDYRIPDFSKLIKLSRLTQKDYIYNSVKALPLLDIPTKHLSKLTKYWPLVYSESLILNIPLLTPLIEYLGLIYKSSDKIEREKLYRECLSIIDSFIETEKSNVTLTLPPALVSSLINQSGSSFSRISGTESMNSSAGNSAISKSQTKKEIYKHVWIEIKRLVNKYQEFVCLDKNEATVKEFKLLNERLGLIAAKSQHHDYLSTENTIDVVELDQEEHLPEDMETEPFKTTNDTPNQHIKITIGKAVPLALILAHIRENDIKIKMRPKLEARNEAQGNKIELYSFLKDKVVATNNGEPADNNNKTNEKN